MIPQANVSLERKEKLLDRLYHITLTIGVVFIAITVFLTAQKSFQTANKVDGQTTFIVNYLRCIGQTPTNQRGPAATNSCFERFAPKDVE